MGQLMRWAVKETYDSYWLDKSCETGYLESWVVGCQVRRFRELGCKS